YGGIVDEDVYPPEMGRGLLHRSLDILFSGDVASERSRPELALFQVADDLRACNLVDVEQANRRAFLRHADNAGLADANCRARDNRGLAFKSLNHRTLLAGDGAPRDRAK